jgi:hypothetical protein
MSAVINQTAPVTPVVAASQATPQLVLQPGAVIDARVVAVRENLARILIAGLSLDVLTEVALQPGANLKLAVSQTADGVVRLAVVPQGTPGGPQGQAAAQALSGGPATVVTNSASQTVGATSPAQLPRVASASLAPATPEALAISQAVQTAAPRQASLAPLFANLPVIVASPGVPPQVQGAASQLLATRPPLDATLTADDLRQAFQKSGLFLEATLAKGAAPAGAPDLKAALVVFRQVVSNWLGQATAQPAPAAMPASPTPQGPAASQPLPPGATAQQSIATPTAVPATLPLAPGLVPEPGLPTPLVAGGQLLPPTAEGAGESQTHASASVAVQTATHDLPELSSDVVRTAVQALVRDAAASLVKTDNPPTEASTAKSAVHPQIPPPTPRQTAEAAPPFRGALPTAQPVAAPSLAPDAPAAGMGQKLLEQTDAALARQTLLQVASLPDRPELAGTSQNNQASQPRWSFEIPFATPQGTAMAQFEISRDGGNEVEAAAPTRVWRARFTLDVEPTGPVHALVSLIGEKTAVRMWAERPETAAQLRANADALSQALRQAELEPGDILVGEGAPPQPKARAGRFLDRAT